MKWYILFSILLVLLLAACGGGDAAIEKVTPLPSNEVSVRPTATPSLTPTALTGMSAILATSEAATQQAIVSKATATPLDNNLAVGLARDIALATDTAIQPTPRTALTFDENPVSITFDEFYDGFDMRTGLILSDKLVSLDGMEVVLEGYMAPPLKVELDFFVLTRIRLAYCPFCTTAAEWPDDVAMVYMPEGETTYASEAPMRVKGRMEVGISVDAETGMVSLVRIYADEVEMLN